jgi:ApaG protein
VIHSHPSEGIRVRVRPGFSLARSEPSNGTFVFSYRVQLVNEGCEPAQLLFRYWRIHDAVGEDTEVDGEGVVGQQPVLGPGESHSYASHCVLRSPAGYMEGHYTFARPDGRHFRIAVPRFPLEAPLLPPDGGDEETVLH